MKNKKRKEITKQETLQKELYIISLIFFLNLFLTSRNIININILYISFYVMMIITIVSYSMLVIKYNKKIALTFYKQVSLLAILIFTTMVIFLFSNNLSFVTKYVALLSVLFSIKYYLSVTRGVPATTKVIKNSVDNNNLTILRIFIISGLSALVLIFIEFYLGSR